MAQMTTILTEFSDEGNSRVYTAPTHTALKPVLVLQRRKTPSGNQVILEDVVSVAHATVDAQGVPLPQKVLFSATVRRNINSTAADVTAALALFREAVASDNFTDVVNGQQYIQ